MKNYRTLANNSVDYFRALRDSTVDRLGEDTIAYIPNLENSLDLYSDFDITATLQKGITVVPLFTQYYNVLSALGTDKESNYPLQVIVKVVEHLPRNTLFDLDSVDEAGITYKRRWRVLSTETKHIDGQYAKVAHCVPWREIGVPQPTGPQGPVSGSNPDPPSPPDES